jgi:biotin carboxyl carrier protein
MDSNQQPFQLIVNGQTVALLPDTTEQLDAVQENGQQWHMLDADGKSFRAQVLGFNEATKTFNMLVNGSPFEVRVVDRYDQLIDTMGLSKPKVLKISQIKAPMPGLVLDVAVKAGDEIQVGDKVAILEAMKMENVLKAVGIGRIREVLVTKGQAVEKGQVLFELD